MSHEAPQMAHTSDSLDDDLEQRQAAAEADMSRVREEVGFLDKTVRDEILVENGLMTQDAFSEEHGEE